MRAPGQRQHGYILGAEAYFGCMLPAREVTDGDLATVSAATLDLVRLAIRYFKIGKASCYAYL